MYFEVEHVFEAPIETVEAAMFHPEYAGFLLAHEVLSGVTPESVEDDGAQVRRRIHYAPMPAFEQLGPKKVPPHWFEFIEESVWDKHARKLVFSHQPIAQQVRERLTTRGEIVLEEVAPGRTRRRTRTEIKVQNLPLMLKPFSPMAEQLISREARRMLDAEARALDAWIKTGSVAA